MSISSPSASRCVSAAADSRRRIQPAADIGASRLWPNLSAETQTQIARTGCGTDEANTAAPRRAREGRSVVLIASIPTDERLTTAHRAKLAYVYVRQSSLNQVRQHQESTELQYRLVDRAVGLGWPHERVQVIDEDLGKSGAGSVERHGFQKLIAEIGLGNAGLVISLDASRLRPQQSRLASASRAVLGIRRSHRGWRTAL